MDKTWTATDIKLGKLTITREDSILRVERRYIFVDADQNELMQIAGGRIVEEIEIMNIPQDTLNALREIDYWTYQKALEKEGMNGNSN